ncbi:G5 domain-containing protein [Kamptonema cortianum]|nr:G5 domain-containing protein [Kamptonema cortianum]
MCSQAVALSQRITMARFRSALFDRLIILVTGILLIAGCTAQPQQQALVITLVVDGRERSFQQPVAITVGEFLSDQEVVLGPLDEANPPIFSQLTDGMRITVVRVREENECQTSSLPYRTRSVPNEALAPGEEQLAQAGQAGTEQICYRIQIRDGVRQNPIEVSRLTLTEPVDEVIYVGPSGELDRVPIAGTLAYISNGNVWIMRGSSDTKRTLTNSSDVDPRVFALSADGRQLLVTRQVSGDARDTAFNRLWLIPDTTRDSEPVALVPENVLFADWIPNRPNTISYSTAELTQTTPGWDADNNLWSMRIDPVTGETLDIDEIVPASFGGLDGWWGTSFQWSPDGTALAWIRADSVGLVNLNTGELQPLLSYRVFETRQPWSWRATVSWSHDQSMLLTTVHGLPIGSEPPETSPAFHVAIAALDGSFTAEVVRNAGIWAMPRYSPIRTDAAGNPQGYIAYLRARDLSNSINSSAEYDLVVADRDGSNARVLFPQQGEPALRPNANFTWSPDGQQIAFIYQGDLWIVDVESGISHRLTLDGGASRPVWTR